MTTIAETLPDTGLQMPTAEEALGLFKIVRAACPWIGDFGEQDFAHGILAARLMYRRAQPRSDVAFSWHLSNANQLLRGHFDILPITGPAFLGAIVAHNDIRHRRFDPSEGQLTELALDPYSGAKCANSWRGVLRGDALMSPVAPRVVHQVAPSPVRFFQGGDEQRFWR
jgi:hypothetical protein